MAPGKLVTHCLQSKLHSPLPTASSTRLEPRSTVSYSGHVELDLEAAAWMLGHSLLDTPLCWPCRAPPPCWPRSSSRRVHSPPWPSQGPRFQTISTMTHQLLPSCRPRNPNAHSELPPGYLQSISKPTRLKPSPQPSQPAPLQAPISADNNAILQLLGTQTWHLLCLLSFTSSTAHLSSRFCRLHLPQFWNWSMSHLLHDHHLARPTSPLQSIVTQSSMVAWPRPRHLQSVRYFYCSVSLSTRRQLHQAGLSLFTDRGVASTYCQHTAGTELLARC